MKTYARVDSGMVRELFSTDGDMTEMFHPSLVWIDVTNINPPPQTGWTAVEADGAWTFNIP